MESGEHAILRRSLSVFCERNAKRLAALEKPGCHASAWDELYAELDGLGILHVLHDTDTRHELGLVAETTHCLAACSPSLALLVVQQNLAAHLLGVAGACLPNGWVAMPLYDSPAEWPYQSRLTVDEEAYCVDGHWSSLPALPIASSALLPVMGRDAESFALLRLDWSEPRPGVTRGPVAHTLGLRGCPVSDLDCAGVRIARADVLLRGAAAQRTIESLWSQAEVLMLALRAGILERSYAVARDYARARWQGGKFIVEHSVVQRMLADLYASRCSMEESWRAMSATLRTEEPLSTGQMGMSLRLAAALPRLTSDGIQLLGGYGYMEELGQERLFRDATQCEMLLGHPQAKSFALWQREPR